MRQESKTLGRRTTTLFFRTPEGYRELEKRWAALFKTPGGKQVMNSGFHLFYQAIRGKNLAKSFGVMRRRYKSGMDPLKTLSRSYYQIREHFGDLFSASDIPEMVYRMVCGTSLQNTYDVGAIQDRLDAISTIKEREHAGA